MEPQYPDDEELAGAGISYEDIVRIMRKYSVKDSSADPAAAEADSIPNLLQSAQPEAAEDHQSDVEQAGGADNEAGAQPKAQKKKKKRNKKKSRGKGKQDDEYAQEEVYDTGPIIWRGPNTPPPLTQQQQDELAAKALSGEISFQGIKSIRTIPGPVPGPPGAGSRSSIFKQPEAGAEPLWNNDTTADYKQVREFWFSLSDIEQQALVMVEKEVVLARVRDQQNFSCSCSLCARKREAIERELDCLYHCYYEELKENVHKARLRMWITTAKKRAQSAILDSVEMITDMVVEQVSKCKKADTRESVHRKIISRLKSSPEAKVIFGSEFYKLIELENALQSSNLPELGDVDGKGIETIRDAAELSLQKQISESVEKYGQERDFVKSLSEAMHKCLSGHPEYRQALGEELLMSDAHAPEPTNNNDLFYTDQMLDSIDTFPADSKKFFEMMEHLANYRIRREDAMLSAADGIASLDITGSMHEDAMLAPHELPMEAGDLESMHRRCPDCHVEINEAEDRQYYSDDEEEQANGYGSRKRARAESRAEYYDDEEDEDGDYDDDEYTDEDDDDLDPDNSDEDLDGTDDLDDLDPEGAEREIENGRKVFQLFAARLFEQRVVNAYREKMARDMQRDLIQELEAEEMRSQAKDKRKQKKKQREKEKKRHAQQQKEEERLAREAQARAEEERKRVEAERRTQEAERRRREETERVRKAQEERNRRILEQADRRLERERLEKQRLEREEREANALSQKKASRQKAKAKQRQGPGNKGSMAAEPIASTQQPAVSPVSQAAPIQPQPAPVSSQPAVNSTDLPPGSAPAVAFPASPAASPVAVTPVTPIASAVSHQLAPSSISLLDSLQLQQQLTPTLAPVSAFKTSRPSLPMIHPHEPRNVTPSIPAFPPMRARANSGPSVQQQQASASATAAAFVPPGMSAPQSAGDVPPEIDAAISSIVGRVMGSSTLQYDLTDGTEWRASPTDRTGNNASVAQPHSSRSAVFGLGGPMSLLSDQAMRRNSMPMNRLAADDSSGDARSMCSRAPAAKDEDMEAIYTAYGALERFRRDKTGASPGIAHAQYGGYHSAADIAQMHGRISEGEVWVRCLAHAQLSPGSCSVDHGARAVAFARCTTSTGANKSPNGSGTAQAAQQLPVIVEDLFSAFNMQPSQTASPLLASVRAPLVGMAAHPQPRSPMLQTQTLPGLGPMPATAAQSFGQSFAQQQQQQQQQQAGIGYSQAPQGMPSLFMGPLGMHTSPGAMHNQAMHPGSAPPPFSVSPFQGPALGSAGLGARHSSDSPLGSMLPPLSMASDNHPAYSLAYGPPSFIAANPWSPAKHAGGSDGPQIHPLHAFARHPQALHPQHPQQQRSPGHL
ncbi:Stress response protein nst1 [Coemansia erecta]|nr:Stress response protein nst1 [Coemansia erecta]